MEAPSLPGVDLRLEANRDVHATINFWGSGRSDERHTAAGLPTRSPDELACASADLLSWPRDIGGHRFERPELAFVEEHLKRGIAQNDGNRTVLLFGQPGSGKSALLALLGEKLATAGATVLGIKADMLPPSVDSIAGLGRALDLGEDLLGELRAQASRGPLYILVDQLDAVASLIDGSGGRLYALTHLVRRLRTTPGVGIAVSARRFEFEADGAFRSAFPPDAVQVVELELPSLAAVDDVLRRIGIDPTEIPDSLREVSRIPQALRDIVLARQAGFPWSAMTSWRQAQSKRFERLMEQNVQLPLDRVVRHLIEKLRETGALWIEEAGLALGTGRAVERLLAEGILRRREGLRQLGFAHQTWAETLDARFALAEGNLVERVGAAGGNLLARPQALAMLRFVRDDAQGTYDEAIRVLWADRTLRRHLRHLVLDVAASDPSPTQAEQQLVTAVVAGDDASLAERALRMSAGKPRWFGALRNAVSGRMAAPDDERAWSVLPWLSAAAPFEGAEVLRLVRRHWLSETRRSQFALFALERLERWEEEAFEQFRNVLQGAVSVQFRHLAVVRQHAEKGRHEVAARLLATIWDRIVELTIAEVEQERARTGEPAPTEQNSLEAAAVRLMEENRLSFAHRFSQHLKELTGLHDFAAFTRKAPAVYLEQLVPRLACLDVAGAIGDAAQHISARDWWEWHALGYRHGADAATFDVALVEAIRAALQEHGRLDPSGFVLLVEAWKGRLPLLDRLFAMAFADGMPALADAALAFLECSPDNLELGDRHDDDLADTLRLIEALSPCVDQRGNDRLVAIVKGWNKYDIDPTDELIVRRRTRLTNRRTRARLLMRLDPTRLSRPTHRYVQEEARACPGADVASILTRVGSVRPPMSVEAMVRAEDRHIVKLFDDLASLPRDKLEKRSWSFVGGTREASYAFAEFAKKEPSRALGLLDRFPPEIGRAAIGGALVSLADAEDIDPKLVLAGLDSALLRGFGGEEFERDAASALESLALRLNGLDDGWVGRLVSWLRPPRASTSEALPTRGRRSAPEEKELPTTVLLETGRLRFITAGNNYTVMKAVTNGLLCREPHDYEQWIKFLEKRAAEPETDAVWEHFCRDLVYVSNVDQGRVSRLLSDIFRSRPHVRDSQNAAVLVARLLRFLPGAFVDEVLDAWHDSKWPLGHIAFGEVSALRAALLGPDYSIASLLDHRSQAGMIHPDILAGIANFAIEYWNDDDAGRRSWARTTLEPLAGRREPRIAKVCADIVRRVAPWPQEHDLREVMRLLARNPVALREVPDSAVDDRLMDLVDDPTFHDAMLDFIEALVDAKKSDLRDHRTTGPFLARSLIPIVLTMHRDRASRERTLVLFEKLLDLVPDAAEETLGKFE